MLVHVSSKKMCLETFNISFESHRISNTMLQNYQNRGKKNVMVIINVLQLFQVKTYSPPGHRPILARTCRP